MPANDIIGFVAATLTTASFIPQVWHTYRTRDVSGISLGMYSLFTVGVAMWLVYGCMTDSGPIMVANAITLALALTILAIKLGAGVRRADELVRKAPDERLPANGRPASFASPEAS